MDFSSALETNSCVYLSIPILYMLLNYILLFRELFTIAKNAKFKTRLQDFLPRTADGDLLFTFSSIF